MSLRTTLFIMFVYSVNGEVNLITVPRPGEEFVLVSGGTQQPVRESKSVIFETSHKIPENVTIPKEDEADDTQELSPILQSLSQVNRKTFDVKLGGGEGIIAIEGVKKFNKKENKKKASEPLNKSSDIEIDIPVSKTKEINIKENVYVGDTNPNMGVTLDPMSESGKILDKSDTTTQSSVLTTASHSYDILPVNLGSALEINSGLWSSSSNLEAAGTEQKQTSRIQIKKGPNGQDYEYEYIYYYYDDEEDVDNTTDVADLPSSTTEVPVYNAHDGPQKSISTNQITPNSISNKPKSRYSTIDRSSTTTVAPSTATPEPAQNEIVPSSPRLRYRGRNLTPAPTPAEPSEERLPASTRFPPRSRNINTTPTAPEVTSEIPKIRGRPQSDSVADESIGQTRSRTRAHVRRPSSELVDLASFTHSGDPSVSQYKEIQSRIKADEKAQKLVEANSEIPALIDEDQAAAEVDATPDSPRHGHSIALGAKEQDLFEDTKESEYLQTTTAFDRETTEYTTMTAMDKVALELYAYLAGENLNNDVLATTDDLFSYDGFTSELSEEASTTELTPTTELATTTTITITTTKLTTPEPTTTTTTTTTTPVPTVTTRGSRFKLRPGSRARSSASTTPSPEPSTASKGRFSRPSFGRGRSSTAAPASGPVEEKAAKQESSSSNSRPTVGRSRFGSRARGSSTTSTPASTAPDSVASAAQASADHSVPRPRLRPSFNLRDRRPLHSTAASSVAPPSEETAAPAAPDAGPEPTSEAPASSSRGIGRGRLPGLRPLRPGARLNIGGRGALASSTTPSSPATVVSEVAVSEPASNGENQEDNSEQPVETTTANPLQRLRGRPRLNLVASPKVKPTIATPVRRSNPLLARRRPGVGEITESPETAEAAATETAEAAGATAAADDAARDEPEAEEPDAHEEASTEPPRGLSSLLAGRRRLAVRRPGTIL